MNYNGEGRKEERNGEKKEEEKDGMEERRL